MQLNYYEFGSSRIQVSKGHVIILSEYILKILQPHLHEINFERIFYLA